jgi:Xaa-Pro dipeptidase
MSPLLNYSRAQDYLRHGDLAALIATSAANVRYFSGYVCWMETLFREFMLQPGSSAELSIPAFVLFPVEGDLALIVKSAMSLNAASLGINDIRVYGSTGFDNSLSAAPRDEIEARFLTLTGANQDATTAVDALAAALRDRGLGNARIGLEMEGLSGTTKRAIFDALPKAEIRDCSNLIRLIRAVKTPMEITLLAGAAEIAEEAARESLAEVKVGSRTRDLVQRFREGVGQRGAQYDHFSLSLAGMGITSEPDREFRDDDVMFIDYGCIVSGYFSDSGTTLAFSQLLPELERRRGALLSSVQRGAARMRPDVRASIIQEEMMLTLREAGITNCFPHGHGMGLEIRDYPILVPANGLKIQDETITVESDLPLEAGMVINLEAPLFMPAVGALQVEQSFVITADGCRELAQQSRSQPWIAAESVARSGPFK